MEYYNKNNEKFDMTNFHYYSKGHCARVYTDGEIAFKVYNLDCKYKFYLSKKMFKILRKLNIINLVELIDYYSEYKNSILPMDAYSMKLVKGDDVKITTASKDYSCDILNQLEKTIEELTENKILLFDAHCGNILFKENGVTIIDPDLFYRRTFLSKKLIYEENERTVFKYINDTIVEEMNDKKVSTYIIPHFNTKKRSLKLDFFDSIKDDNIYNSIIL